MQVGPLLIDMVSCVIPTSRKVLRAAQQEEQACSRLVHAVETIAAVTNYSSSSPSQRVLTFLILSCLRCTHYICDP